MFRETSRLIVDGLRRSSMAMARMLRAACRRSARDRDPFRLGEKLGGDNDRLLMRDRSKPFDVSGLQNNRVTATSPSPRATADSLNAATLRIARPLFHQLIIASPCSVLGRGTPDSLGHFISANCN